MKNRGKSIFAALIALSLAISPAILIGCSDDDDNKEKEEVKNDTPEDKGKETKNEEQPQKEGKEEEKVDQKDENDATNFLKFVVVSNDEISIKGFLDTINGHTIDKTLYKNIDIPSEVNVDGVLCKVVAVEEEAFNYCLQLENVTIPNTVRSIGNRAFYGCANLDLVIPKSVVSFGSKFAYNCKSVTGLYTLVSGKIGAYDYVDLGLPSGVKWASYNVGSTKITGYGDYFAWGETKGKEDYSWNTYKWGSSAQTLTKYCADSENGTVDGKSVLDASDDAVVANWGGSWRMPTAGELRELKDNCKWEWTKDFSGSGVCGKIGTSLKNGNTIFLPAAGSYDGKEVVNETLWGDYWSSSLSDSNSSLAGYLDYCGDYRFVCSDYDRYNGLPVRAVSK